MQDDIIFSVSVPATSANVGVGYDCLGLAFNLRAHFTFREADELEIDGCPSRFQNDDNLVWQAYCMACDKLALPVLFKSRTAVGIPNAHLTLPVG